MPAKQIPPYKPLTLTKDTAKSRYGLMDDLLKLFDVDKVTYWRWGKIIPPPYADRFIHSNYGQLDFVPRHVLVVDALIIFKTFRAMAEHFGKSKVWDKGYLKYLPECESGFMLKHYSHFVRAYTIEEIERINYR